MSSTLQTTVKSPPSLTMLFNAFPTIYDILFAHISLLNLIQVALTCRAGYEAVQSYKRRAFSINRLLARFFDDPQAFRCLQAHTGTLISGSQALQFFTRKFWFDSDLDIYIPDIPADILEVAYWLLGQGYFFRNKAWQPIDILEAVHIVGTSADNFIVQLQNIEYVHASVKSVLDFEKKIEGTDDILKIQMIVAKRSPMEVILSFHSTVMNFISWNRAYSLYPYATIEESRTLVCYIPPTPEAMSRAENALHKYELRGFKVVRQKEVGEDPRCAFHLGDRSVNDRHSFIVRLNTDGFKNSPCEFPRMVNFDPCSVHGWSVKICDGDRMLPMMQHQCFEIKCETLDGFSLPDDLRGPLVNERYKRRVSRFEMEGYWPHTTRREETAEILDEWHASRFEI